MCVREPVGGQTVERGISDTHVIVGVDDSLTGLEALREGVRLARGLGGARLRAVRACPSPQAPGAGWGPAQAWTAPLPTAQWDASERQGLEFIRRTFAEALGGLPPDLIVEATVAFAPPWRVLADCAIEADLLVIGASRRWRPLRHSVAAYCSAHAACPVLVVPRHPGARELAAGRGPLGRLRRRRELASLTAASN
jgi:nucleotide-binding universal stress UspA family protein